MHHLVVIEPQCEAVSLVHLIYCKSSSATANRGLQIVEPNIIHLQEKGLQKSSVCRRGGLVPVQLHWRNRKPLVCCGETSDQCSRVGGA